MGDSVPVQRLDMVIAFAIEAKGKPNEGAKWSEVLDTVDELVGEQRLSVSQAAMAMSVGFHLRYEDLVEDLTARQRARPS